MLGIESFSILEADLFETTASERIKQKQQNFEKMRKKKLRRLQPIIQEPLFDEPSRFDWDTTPIILIKVRENYRKGNYHLK